MAKRLDRFDAEGAAHGGQRGGRGGVARRCVAECSLTLNVDWVIASPSRYYRQLFNDFGPTPFDTLVA